MPFRIHDSVPRGEIDNRAKGIVRGKIWLVGWDGPIVLELKGNAWPDLAGCLLTFTNPRKLLPHPQADSLHCIQRGSIGDITASRKVRASRSNKDSNVIPPAKMKFFDITRFFKCIIGCRVQ